MLTKLQRRSDGAVETPDGLFAVNIREVHFVDDEGMNVLRYHANMFSPQTVVKWPKDQYAIIDPVVAGWLLRNGKAYGLTDDELDAYNEAVEAENGEDKKAAEKKAAEEKAAADKAAADQLAADKKAAEEAAAKAAKK
jgi:hypothetical protein